MGLHMCILKLQFIQWTFDIERYVFVAQSVMFRMQSVI